jgi:hypothetical protein
MFELTTDFVIDLQVDHVLKGQGIDPAKASAKLVEPVEAVLAEMGSLLEPAALYGTLPVLDFQHRTITFEGGTFEGELVTRAMAGASEISLALCSIGPKLDERVVELMNTNAMQALALEGAGNAAIRVVSNTVAERITTALESRGLKAGMKTQPGQEGWPIEQQRLFFSLIPAERINVKLTDSCLMMPRKSVTFAIAAGKEMCADAEPCDFCTKRDRCKWRKEKAASS